VWDLFNLSKSLRARPSDLLGIRHNAVRFYFDRVIVGVGQTIEAEIQIAQKNCKTDTAAAGKAQLVLNRWLRTEGRAKYKDPAAG
jgi:hypothetical protein